MLGTSRALAKEVQGMQRHLLGDVASTRSVAREKDGHNGTTFLTQPYLRCVAAKNVTLRHSRNRLYGITPYRRFSCFQAP